MIDAILEADRTAPVQQRHTAKRIFERLRDEHGYGSGYTVVKDPMRTARASGRETFVPLAHPPGHARVDFGRRSPPTAARTERSISSAWTCRFGCVPPSILYHNTKIAVAKICGGGRRERTRASTELVNYYLLRDLFGRPGKGNRRTSATRGEGGPASGQASTPEACRRAP